MATVIVQTIEDVLSSRLKKMIVLILLSFAAMC